MHWLIPKLISSVLLLPFNLLILLGVGIFLLNRHPRIGKKLIVISWLALWILSTPFISGSLRQTLETTTPLPPDHLPDNVDAIVVLGGGAYCQAPEYGDDTVSADALERLRYAAELHRRSGKPILVTGGKLANPTAEAVFMKQTLEHDFHTPVQWTEERSRDTFENAYFSAEILLPQNVKRIFLITHAWHMPRAQAVFERAGLEVVPAPTKFTTSCRLTPLSFLPASFALSVSGDALHEWIGLLWYRLR